MFVFSVLELFENKRHLEKLIGQLVDGSRIDERLVVICCPFYDIKETVAHLHFDAHLEPLVVNVEAGANLGRTVEAFGDEVVDEFISMGIGQLIVFLRGKVDLGIDAAKNIRTDVVVAF